MSESYFDLYFYPHPSARSTQSAFKILLSAYRRYNIYMNKRFESPDFCGTLDDLLPNLKRPRHTDPPRSANDEKAKSKKQSKLHDREPMAVKKKFSE